MSTATRVSRRQAISLNDQLSDRDKAILQALGTTKLLTGEQLDRLFFSYLSDLHYSRTRRRVLNRLISMGLVTTLARQIGGIRAGSRGLVYCLDVAGQFLIASWREMNREHRTRRPRTPGLPFLNHSLAVSEAFVSLTTFARVQSFKLARFLTEPDCWWPLNKSSTQLRPDAFVLVENDDYESAWWLEIDQGTENIGRIRAKLTAYQGFARSGGKLPHGLLPRVLFATPEAARVQAIAREITHGDFSSLAQAALQADIAPLIYSGLAP